MCQAAKVVELEYLSVIINELRGITLFRDRHATERAHIVSVDRYGFNRFLLTVRKHHEGSDTHEYGRPFHSWASSNS
jgi:hypothetical protein